MSLGPIVTACDEHYAMPLATALRSIADANRSNWPLEFYVLFDGLPQSTRNKVDGSLPPRSAVIRWVPVDLRLYNQFGTMKYPKIVYARCLLPEIFTSQVPKVLY